MITLSVFARFKNYLHVSDYTCGHAKHDINKPPKKKDFRSCCI